MTDSYLSRADLVRALTFRQSIVTTAVADLLGLQYVPPAIDDAQPMITDIKPLVTSANQTTTFTPDPVLLWRAVRLTPRGEVERVSRDQSNVQDLVPDTTASDQPPLERVSWEPLAQKREVLTMLRTRTGRRRSRGEVDIEQVVDRLSHGEILQRLPREHRRTWGSGLFLLQDRARHLVPYWQDQDHLVQLLGDYYPHYGLTVARRWPGQQQPEVMLPDCRAGDAAWPNPTDVVLVVGDLGVLSRDPTDQEFWLDFGRKLHAAEVPVLVLTPCRPDHFDVKFRQLYGIIPWEHAVATSAAHEDSSARLEQLLTLVSPATRLEPGLLRSIRRMLPEMRGHADLEARVWNSELINSQHSIAASFDPQQAKTRRIQFAQMSLEKKLAVACLIRNWHGELHETVWYEELLGLDRQLLSQFPQDTVAARQTFMRLIAEVDHRREQSPEAWLGYQSWGRGVWGRLPRQVKSDPIIGRTMHQMWEGVRGSGPQNVEGFDPRMIEVDSQFDQPVAVDLWQHDGRVTAQFGGEKPERASWWGQVKTLNRRIVLSPDEDFVGIPVDPCPSWASRIGRDTCGLYADLEYGGVCQRLRWIPPGSFRMGSPETEAGRFANEGPAHDVTLTSGYWLFDTPCTQALWEAVMGTNPSYFVSSDRPVEQVSWDDVQQFLERLNGKAPGLELSLPTEAQWEYACRASTVTATWLGDLEILGESNAPLLDSIAWYGGNSGVDFDLQDGIDSSDWAEKQYDHHRAGTREVRQKSANPWGLYDALGNVWEWCQDGRRNYSAQPVTDPVGPTDAGAARVLRGGGWSLRARSVRAAYRDWFAPDLRGHYVGFRCARVQATEDQQAESMRSESERSAEHRGDRAASYGAVDFNLAGGNAVSRAMPVAERLIVISDLQEIEVDCDPRPPWADNFGRDACGLYADLEYGGVCQRMRWIPPGSFRMGSPETEAGRFANEGPAHDVTLTSGYWLFDTPCTQALWEAVMGTNPSYFVSSDRPVEQVSWDDVQQFLERLNGKAPGLELSLPTEAQWEYACRASTVTATWLGDFEILGENNAPLLDSIAWYGGNSGVNFDLKNGWDSSGWPKKQYDHHRAGTRGVRQKSANPWGLYDMLGNVWEWCQDGKRDYLAESVADPVGMADSGADRVLRGGGWGPHARVVRAAYRVWDAPVDRFRFIGFRCARVQVREKQRAEV